MADDAPPPFDPNAASDPVAGAPPFDPNSGATPAAEAPPPFDPTAPSTEAPTNILPAMGQEFSNLGSNLKQNLGPSNTEQFAKEAQESPFWDMGPSLRYLKRVGQGILEAVGSPFQAAGIVGAGGIAGAEQPLGLNYDPDKMKAALQAGKSKEEALAESKETPAQTYQRWRGNVDKAMLSIPAGPEGALSRTATVPKALPAPPVAPTPGPFGVTQSVGEETGDLAARIKEQEFLRQGSPHAQAFREQRATQLAQAPQEAAAAFDPFGQNMATSSQEASDVVSNALNQQQKITDTAIQNNERALNAQHETIRTGLSPSNSTLAESPLEAANIASGAVANEAERAQGAIDQAYGELEDLPGQFHPATFNQIGAKIKAKLGMGSDPVLVDPQTTPRANAAINDIDDVLSDIKQVRDPDTGQIVKKPPITPQVVDNARKRLNTFYGDALQAARASGNWADVRATRRIMDTFDAQVADRLKKGTFTGGDPSNVISTMQNARQIYSNYRKTFTPQGAGDSVGRAIQTILGRYEGSAATPEQVTGMLYGNGTQPVAIAKRLKTMFGEDSPEIGAIKQGLYSHITERPPGATAWGPEKVADRIDQFTQGPGRSLVQEYFSPQEISQMRQFGQNLRNHAQGVEDAANPFEGVDFQSEFRKAINGNQDSVGLLNQAMDRLGATSPEGVALKQGLFHHALQPVEGVATWGPKKMGDNLYKLLASTRNSPIYSPAERGVIEDYAKLMRRIEMPKDTFAPSAPAINRAMSVVGYRIGQLIGAMVGRHIPLLPPIVGEFAGITIGGKLEKAFEATRLGKVKAQLPLVSDQIAKYQKAMTAYNRAQNPGTQKLVGIAASNLTNSLKGLGINPSYLQLPGMAPAGEESKKKERRRGGPVNRDDGGGVQYTQSYPEAPGGYPFLTSDPTSQQLEPTADQSADAPVTPPSEPVDQLVSPEHRSILDQLFGISGPRYQTWPERMIRSGATLAGDVASGAEPDYTGLRREDFTDIPNESGGVDWQPTDPMIDRSQDMAALAGGAGASGAEEGAAGIFGGKLAKGADLGALRTAKNMARNDATRDEIWDKTGWFQGKDGGWRFEIPDNGLQVTPEGGIVHPELLKAYPELANVDTAVNRSKTAFGSYWPAEDADKMYGLIDEDEPASILIRGPKKTWPTTAVHELQHFVQDQEGFQPGSNTHTLRSQRFYPRVSGEVEARNAEARLYMTPEERQAIPPWKTQDVPFSRQYLPPGQSPGTKESVELPPGWKTVEGGASADTLSPPVQQLIQYAGITPERWFQLQPIDRQLIQKGFEENQKLQGFHSDLMDTVQSRAQDAAQQAQQYHEEGKLPFPVGSRFTTQHSRENGLLPFEVKGHFVDQRDPNHYGYYVERGQPGQEGWESSRIDVSNPKRPNIADLSKKFQLMSGPRSTLYSDTSQPAAALSAFEKPFYSATERAIQNAPQNKAPASQWLGWLKNQPGVKQEELDWMGLPDMLSGNNPVTKAELLEHAQGHGVGLEEFEKTGFPDFDQLTKAQQRSAMREFEEFVGGPAELSMEYPTEADQLYGVRNWYKEYGDTGGDPTKYHEYQLPGGQNYRELLLTKPENLPYWDGAMGARLRYLEDKTEKGPNQLNPQEQEDYEQLSKIADQRDNTPEPYKSGHWDEPNVLMHMRMNDREIPGVGKSLHLEELQSDWHQKGRKEGYRTSEPLSNQEREEWQKLRNKEILTNDERLRLYDLDTRRQGAAAGIIPDAPFKQSWPELGLKRAITKAANEGYDAISWTPGEQQAARYDLSKHVDSLEYNPDRAHLIGRKGDKTPLNRMDVPPDKLADYVGKDAAEKLLKQPEKKTDVDAHIVERNGGFYIDDAQGNELTHGFFTRPQAEGALADRIANQKELDNYRKISGLDLKVGGEGMKAFYDKMLVDKANAIGKKYGAKVEWKELPGQVQRKSVEGSRIPKWEEGSGTKVPVLKLTPELKKAASSGMPLFSDTSKPGAALSGLEKPPVNKHGLTYDQEEMLMEWKSNNGRRLRTSEKFTKLLSALPQAPGTVYRGVDLSRNDIAGLKPGSTYTMNKHSATSISKKIAKEFYNYSNKTPVLMEIVQKSGRKLPEEGGGEREVVIPKGTRFKVLSKTQVPNHDIFHVKLRELP